MGFIKVYKYGLNFFLAYYIIVVHVHKCVNIHTECRLFLSTCQKNLIASLFTHQKKDIIDNNMKCYCKKLKKSL